jgi:antitoxin (DNA-binding transcriptional repressor) of toxin-antitoxin stability system
MRVGVAEARKRFAELLERAMRGETVEVARRDEVIAVIGPPPPSGTADPLPVALDRWRRSWDVGDWPDDDAFRGLRDRSEGRPSPW